MIMTRATNLPRDRAGRTYGYRYFLPADTAWKAAYRSHRPRPDRHLLVGPYMPFVDGPGWAPGINSATCTRKAAQHPVPSADCSCGIRLLSTLAEVCEYLMGFLDAKDYLSTPTYEAFGMVQEDAVLGRATAAGRQVDQSPFNRLAMVASKSADDYAHRVEKSQLLELYVPGNRSVDFARKLKSYYGVPVLRSNASGREFWQELAPDADPERLGCHGCIGAGHGMVSRQYPVCDECMRGEIQSRSVRNVR